MQTGLKTRMKFLFNRHGDGRAVCVAADHGYMSDVAENVARLRPITEAIIRGAWMASWSVRGRAAHRRVSRR